jgi:hypothetical protein
MSPNLNQDPRGPGKLEPYQKLLSVEKERLEQLAHSNPGVVRSAVAIFERLAGHLASGGKQPDTLLESLRILSQIVENCLCGPSTAPLEIDGWPLALALDGAHQRLQAALVLSTLFRQPIADTEGALTVEELTNSLFTVVIHSRKEITKDALVELKEFCRNAPSFVTQTIATLYDHEFLSSQSERPYLQPFMHALDTAGFLTGVATCIVEHQLSAEVASTLTTAVASIPQHLLRHAMMEKLQLLCKNGVVRVKSGDKRLPYPLGRPAAIAAIKTLGSQGYHEIGGPSKVHEFDTITPPATKAEWNYIGQRLQNLMRLHNPTTAGEETYRFLTQTIEMCVARPLFDANEALFNQITRGQKADYHHSLFFKHDYGADNPPAADSTPAYHISRQESLNTLRSSAFIRDSINLRKGYTRGRKWLLEEIFEHAGGQVERFRVADIEKYPGPGCRISGLRVSAALDWSTQDSRRYYKKACPWLRKGLGSLPIAEFFHMRGFIAISPRLELINGEPIAGWKGGSIRGTPYVFVWFNDHFHNLHGPEIRTWLIPATVFKQKFAPAKGLSEYNDLNDLDITPEGFLMEATQQKLPIFSVSTSSVLWGGLANAAPQGYGPASSWEVISSWNTSKWQDPFHIHRALVGNQYHRTEDDVTRRIFNIAQAEHRLIQAKMRFGHDLYASFLTIEEQVAKGFLTRGKPPPLLRFPKSGSNQPEQSGLKDNGANEGVAESAGFSSEDSHNGLSSESLAYTAPRTFLLERFLEQRNALVRRGTPRPSGAFPQLQIDYTRLFRKQPGTPYITGHDMMLNLPDGKVIPLVRDAVPGQVMNRPVFLDEGMEFLYHHHVVSQFRTNNCPRIVLP